MTIDLTPVVHAVIVVAVALASAYLVPFIKRKVESKKLSQIIVWVETLVACADQIFERHQGAEKKAYVIERINAILAQHNLQLDLQSIENLIEAAVLRLHSELKADGVIEQHTDYQQYYVKTAICCLLLYIYNNKAKFNIDYEVKDEVNSVSTNV